MHQLLVGGVLLAMSSAPMAALQFREQETTGWTTQPDQGDLSTHHSPLLRGLRFKTEKGAQATLPTVVQDEVFAYEVRVTIINRSGGRITSPVMTFDPSNHTINGDFLNDLTVFTSEIIHHESVVISTSALTSGGLPMLAASMLAIVAAGSGLAWLSRPHAPVPAATPSTRLAAPAAAEAQAHDAGIDGQFLLSSGAPAAGSAWTLQGFASNENAVMEHGLPVDWTDPSGTLDADGRIRFRFPSPGAYQYVFTVDAEGHVPASWRWGSIGGAPSLLAARRIQTDADGRVQLRLGAGTYHFLIDSMELEEMLLTAHADWPLPAGADDIVFH